MSGREWHETEIEPEFTAEAEAVAQELLDGMPSAGGPIEINLYDNGHGQFQLAIEAPENGSGYRIFGPKFMGEGRLLRRCVLDERDVTEIRRYLDRAH